MKIELSKGMVAIIDDDDFDLVKSINWYALNSRGRFYAHAVIDGKSVLMHRIIMSVPDGMFTDHINNDSLDNRKSNLRICTHSENMRNRKLSKASKSGLKNVWQELLHGKLVWRATVWVDKKRHRKNFKTKEDASAWAISKREYLHGIFAYKEEQDSRID